MSDKFVRIVAQLVAIVSHNASAPPEKAYMAIGAACTGYGATEEQAIQVLVSEIAVYTTEKLAISNALNDAQ